MGAIAHRITAHTKNVVFLSFAHLYSTLLPQVWAVRLKPRGARHGRFTPPRISPSCPHENGWTGVSLCADGVVAKQLVRCFVDGWVPLAALFGRLLCGKTAQAGLGASSKVALRWLGAPSGNVFQSPDMTGLARCFSRCGEGTEKTPSLCRQREGLFYAIFSKIFLSD